MIGRSWLAWLPWTAIAQAILAPAPPSNVGAPSAAIRAFAPGVRINWRRQVVEVDAEVVLRTGPLELLACSPRTREHESILAVRAQPMHIYQAMGLVGMQPGSPTQYDPTSKEWLAPSGDPLNLRVRTAGEDSTDAVPVEKWLLDVSTNRPPKKINWVFAGSVTTPGGRFGADADGTVVCVVDFESALITVAARHSADNARLWLAANTKAIPPTGTACTLVIFSPQRVIFIDVALDGTLRRVGEPVSTADIVKATKAGGRDARCVLRCAPGVTRDVADQVVKSLVKQGVTRQRVVVDLDRPAEATHDRPKSKPNTQTAPVERAPKPGHNTSP